MTHATSDTNVDEVLKKVPEKRIYQPQYLLKDTTPKARINVIRKQYLNGLLDCPSVIYHDKKKILSLHSFEEATFFLEPDRYYIRYEVNNSGCINLEFYQHNRPKMDILSQERQLEGDTEYTFSISEHTGAQ
ncbi:MULTISPECIES: hypothetical protein [Acinetobacter]|uniref:Uncharacterized protein n=1 Tax=Acinetobacter seifertii TaxID=1530123 RepID=A0A2T5QUM0_9GAMM|nr:hypothetical protein [Acinetobacter seifertii]NUF51659.1 hypothetical protein [Acinetobacter seifertii]PTV52175.1 hypothetical protein DBL04_15320 [Acinetobacter seifertii]QNX35593.1 hypothetical protein IC788_15520 [Acinetobacter seifertii]TEU28481.1 hypothetical protein E2R16_08025 [Acinetobacter seifertii]